MAPYGNLVASGSHVALIRKDLAGSIDAYSNLKLYVLLVVDKLYIDHLCDVRRGQPELR